MKACLLAFLLFLPLTGRAATSHYTDAQRRASAAKIKAWATHAQANLDAANATIDKQNKDATILQSQIDEQAADKARAEKALANAQERVAKLTKEVFWFKLPLAICAASCVLLLLLKFGVPNTGPYGIAITAVVPIVTFSSIMLL